MSLFYRLNTFLGECATLCSSIPAASYGGSRRMFKGGALVRPAGESYLDLLL
jgi:hypothetical protein